MKLFGTDGIRGKANEYPITAEVALQLGKAIGLQLANGEKQPTFIIGKDTRISGEMLESALAAGLTSVGARVVLAGFLPTPAIAFLVRELSAQGGIMISASHNPHTDNGIKFFGNTGQKLSDKSEAAIENMILHEDMSVYAVSSEKMGRIDTEPSLQEKYISFAQNTIGGTSLSGLKIVIDCAHGAAFNVAPLIFEGLGAEVVILGDAPNGHNINDGVGALYPEIMGEVVVAQNADIGIGLDGDADRIILVDENGAVFDGDFILAIAALDMQKKGILKKSTVVATHYTNLALDALMKENAAEVARVQNGDRYVIEEMDTSGFNLGGEYTGHIIFSDHNPTGDGIVAGLQIVRIMQESQKKLSELGATLKKYPQVVLSVEVVEKKPLEEMQGLQKEIKNAEDTLGNSGRHLIRYSGTEMKARVMIEGEDELVINEIAHTIAQEIQKEVGNISS